MKKVIRYGVFETNSSSTHSVVFKRKKSEQKEPTSSAEIYSGLHKIIFLQGLINNAQMEESSFDGYDEEVETGEQEPFNIEEFEEFFEKNEDLKKIFIESQTKKTRVGFMPHKEMVLEFLKLVKEFYMQENNLTSEQLEQKIDGEKMACNNEILCDCYFGNGVLIECTCKFKNYYEIANELKIAKIRTQKTLEKRARAFISNEYKFVLRELYCGVIPLVNDTIY